MNFKCQPTQAKVAMFNQIYKHMWARSLKIYFSVSIVPMPQLSHITFTVIPTYINVKSTIGRRVFMPLTFLQQFLEKIQ